MFLVGKHPSTGRWSPQFQKGSWQFVFQTFNLSLSSRLLNSQVIYSSLITNLLHKSDSHNWISVFQFSGSFFSDYNHRMISSVFIVLFSSSTCWVEIHNAGILTATKIFHHQLSLSGVLYSPPFLQCYDFERTSSSKINCDGFSYQAVQLLT